MPSDASTASTNAKFERFPNTVWAPCGVLPAECFMCITSFILHRHHVGEVLPSLFYAWENWVFESLNMTQLANQPIGKVFCNAKHHGGCKKVWDIDPSIKNQEFKLQRSRHIRKANWWGRPQQEVPRGQESSLSCCRLGPQGLHNIWPKGHAE